MEPITSKIIDYNYSLLDRPKFTLEQYKDTDLSIEVVRKAYRPLQFIDQASKLVLEAIQSPGIIVVVVDIDNDGISSGVVTNLILQHVFNLDWNKFRLVISSRCYRRGFNQDILNKIANIHRTYKNISLILTADMGTPDESYYKILKALYPETKIVVTDHHQVPENNYPVSANYLINPQQDDTTDYKNICGCCVLYELLRKTAIEANLDIDYLDKISLPYVATATIVDMMPMSDLYNRLLIRDGLIHINNKEERNYDMYRKIFNHKAPFTFNTLSKNIGPLVNTANRAGKEEFMLFGLVTPDNTKNQRILEAMADLNTKRKEQTKILLKEALKDIDKRYKDSYVVAVESKLQIGGLIAGKIADRYSRPSVVFNNIENKDILEGSGRAGLQELDILAMFKAMPDDVVASTGGHKQACGVSVYSDKLEEFKSLFNKAVQDALPNIVIPEEHPVLELDIKDVNFTTGDDIVAAGPYGINWPQPLVKIKDTLIVNRVIPIQDFFKVEVYAEELPEHIISIMIFFSTLLNKDLTFANFMDIIKTDTKLSLHCYIRSSVYRGSPTLEIEARQIFLQ